jgi:hypothetical protein
MFMKPLTCLFACTLLVLSGCAMTQQPAAVLDSVAKQPAPAVSQATPTASAIQSHQPAYGDAAPHGSGSVVPAGLTLDKLQTIAKARQKSSAELKRYVGQNLHGQAKFVKTAKGNPNALVADVRVNGLGEVSLWCRNVLGAYAPNRATGFDGVLTGEVYTSEDFSHDIYLKDCRFRD